MKNKITIHPLPAEAQQPYELLLLADPSIELVNQYTALGTVYIARYEDNVIACYVLYPLNNDTVEIKNIAVDEKFQNQGIGSFLLQDAVQKAKEEGYKEILTGTGNSSIGQLYLYQKAGFKITGIRKNFFRDHYTEPIWENGIECTDMIILTMQL